VLLRAFEGLYRSLGATVVRDCDVVGRVGATAIITLGDVKLSLKGLVVGLLPVLVVVLVARRGGLLFTVAKGKIRC
jgi:hypothetical protein